MLRVGLDSSQTRDDGKNGGFLALKYPHSSLDPTHGSEQCFLFCSAFVLFDVRGLFVFKRSEVDFCSVVLFGAWAFVRWFLFGPLAVLFLFGRSLENVFVL